MYVVGVEGGPRRPERGVGFPGMELQVIGSRSVWALETKLWFSVKTLRYKASSPAPTTNMLAKLLSSALSLKFIEDTLKKKKRN